MVEKILLLTLHVQEPLDLITNYNSVCQVCQFWKILMLSERARQFLPQIYMPSQEIFPKANKVMVKVNMQRLIRNADPFSGLLPELTRILKHKIWNLAWIEMCLISFHRKGFLENKEEIKFFLRTFVYFMHFYSDALDLTFQL